MKVFAIAVILLVVSSSSALGSGLDLTWGACATDGGYSDLQFPCACPGLPIPLIGTFLPPLEIDDFLELDFIIDYQNDAPVLQDFWRFQTPFTPNECNGGIVLGDERPSIGCTGTANPWGDYPPGGQAYVSLIFVPNPGGVLNRGRLMGSVYRSIDHPTTLTAEVQTFGFHIDLYADFATESGGTCGGCNTDTEILFNQANLISKTGGPWVIVGPGSVSQVAYTASYGRVIDCLPTPTQRSTWGLLKSLYR